MPWSDLIHSHVLFDGIGTWLNYSLKSTTPGNDLSQPCYYKLIQDPTRDPYQRYEQAKLRSDLLFADVVLPNSNNSQQLCHYKFAFRRGSSVEDGKQFVTSILGLIIHMAPICDKLFITSSAPGFSTISWQDINLYQNNKGLGYYPLERASANETLDDLYSAALPLIPWLLLCSIAAFSRSGAQDSDNIRSKLQLLDPKGRSLMLEKFKIVQPFPPTPVPNTNSLSSETTIQNELFKRAMEEKHYRSRKTRTARELTLVKKYNKYSNTSRKRHVFEDKKDVLGIDSPSPSSLRTHPGSYLHRQMRTQSDKWLHLKAGTKIKSYEDMLNFYDITKYAILRHDIQAIIQRESYRRPVKWERLGKKIGEYMVTLAQDPGVKSSEREKLYNDLHDFYSFLLNNPEQWVHSNRVKPQTPTPTIFYTSGRRHYAPNLTLWCNPKAPVFSYLYDLDSFLIERARNNEFLSNQDLITLSKIILLREEFFNEEKKSARIETSELKLLASSAWEPKSFQSSTKKIENLIRRYVADGHLDSQPVLLSTWETASYEEKEHKFDTHSYNGSPQTNDVLNHKTYTGLPTYSEQTTNTTSHVAELMKVFAENQLSSQWSKTVNSPGGSAIASKPSPFKTIKSESIHSSLYRKLSKPGYPEEALATLKKEFGLKINYSSTPCEIHLVNQFRIMSLDSTTFPHYLMQDIADTQNCLARYVSLEDYVKIINFKNSITQSENTFDDITIIKELTRNHKPSKSVSLLTKKGLDSYISNDPHVSKLTYKPNADTSKLEELIQQMAIYPQVFPEPVIQDVVNFYQKSDAPTFLTNYAEIPIKEDLQYSQQELLKLFTTPTVDTEMCNPGRSRDALLYYDSPLNIEDRFIYYTNKHKLNTANYKDLKSRLALVSLLDDAELSPECYKYPLIQNLLDHHQNVGHYENIVQYNNRSKPQLESILKPSSNKNLPENSSLTLASASSNSSKSEEYFGNKLNTAFINESGGESELKTSPNSFKLTAHLDKYYEDLSEYVPVHLVEKLPETRTYGRDTLFEEVNQLMEDEYLVKGVINPAMKEMFHSQNAKPSKLSPRSAEKLHYKQCITLYMETDMKRKTFYKQVGPFNPESSSPSQHNGQQTSLLSKNLTTSSQKANQYFNDYLGPNLSPTLSSSRPDSLVDKNAGMEFFESTSAFDDEGSQFTQISTQTNQAPEPKPVKKSFQSVTGAKSGDKVSDFDPKLQKP